MTEKDIRQYTAFRNQLSNAVNWAMHKPEPTKEQSTKFKALLKNGVTNGQYRIVVQAYNSVINSVKHRKTYKP